MSANCVSTAKSAASARRSASGFVWSKFTSTSVGISSDSDAAGATRDESRDAAEGRKPDDA